MVEFAAVLLPLLVIVVGIIQFGLLFGAGAVMILRPQGLLGRAPLQKV